MKINSVGQSTRINMYSDNKKKVSSSASVQKGDTVQISSEGRNLSNLTMEKSYESSPAKLEAIKNQVSQGTYKPNPKLIAQRMMDTIKGREF